MVFAANVILDKILDSGIALSPHFDEYKDALRMLEAGDIYEAARIHRKIYNYLQDISGSPSVGVLYYFSWSIGSMAMGYEDRNYRIAQIAACANLLEGFPQDHPQGFAIVNNILNSAPK